MKVALIHYWLVNMRGGERVLESLCRLYPSADIYTLVYDPSAVSDDIKKHRIHTSFIQRLPKAVHWYQKYIGLMPLALERFDLRGYDLVISSESGPAKGVITDPSAIHICYCHSPMRYIWDLRSFYSLGKGILYRWMMEIVFHYLRIWDVSTAARVDLFVANSSFVRDRIKKYWRRDSKIVHPPVDIGRFQVSSQSEDYYLFLGQLTTYKRPELVVEAFKKNGKKLVIVGEGELSKKLKRSQDKNIVFYGRCDNFRTAELLSRCKALVFPGLEDFGIVPLEAMACGKPVIAFKKGGVLDTVRERETGLFFESQTAESLNEAIEKFELDHSWVDPERIRKWAEGFNEAVFHTQIQDSIREAGKLG